MDEQTVLKVEMPTQVILKLTARNLNGDAGTTPPFLAGVSQPQLISLTHSKDFHRKQLGFSIMTPLFLNYRSLFCIQFAINKMIHPLD